MTCPSDRDWFGEDHIGLQILTGYDTDAVCHPSIAVHLHVLSANAVAAWGEGNRVVSQCIGLRLKQNWPESQRATCSS